MELSRVHPNKEMKGKLGRRGRTPLQAKCAADYRKTATESPIEKGKDPKTLESGQGWEIEQIKLWEVSFAMTRKLFNRKGNIKTAYLKSIGVTGEPNAHPTSQERQRASAA